MFTYKIWYQVWYGTMYSNTKYLTLRAENINSARDKFYALFPGCHITFITTL